MPGPIAEQADLARAGRELGEHHLKRGHRLVRIGIARLLGIAKIIDGLRGDAGGSRGLGRGLGRIRAKRAVDRLRPREWARQRPPGAPKWEGSALSGAAASSSTTSRSCKPASAAAPATHTPVDGRPNKPLTGLSIELIDAP